MHYDEGQIKEIELEKVQVLAAMEDLWLALARDVAPSLDISKANEYLLHGVCRRLKLIRRCVENTFNIFPVDRKAVLTEEEKTDLEINLHAFVININGLQDNLAWVYLFEKGLNAKVKNGALGVGLFKEQTQAHLPAELRDYLSKETIMNWHKQYAKDYRDALAHRIPLYIPPFQMADTDMQKYQDIEGEIRIKIETKEFDKACDLYAKQEAIGKPSLFYAHSTRDLDSFSPMLLHPQVIVDSKTVIEITEMVMRHVRKIL